jgi:SAM-dependent methyltransferase
MLTSAPDTRGTSRIVRPLVALTLFWSAYLLFLVQPMTGRLVLPLLGGTPAVWTTCLVFFQAVLLAAYAWAHVASRWQPRAQMPVHLLVLGGALLALPIGLDGGWEPPSSDVPVGWLLVVLAVSVGLPVFAVATNAPTLQRWFARSEDERRRDPYFLYAVSNAGSLLGLLSYPLLWEPLVPLTSQRWVWSGAYAVLVLLVAGCGAVIGTRPADAGAKAAGEHAPIGARRAIRWMALAAVPSSLTAGVTAYITTDLAPVPLLWVVPLAIYLITFITSFAGHVMRTDAVAVRLFPALALPLAAWHLGGEAPPWVVLTLHLGTFAIVAALCHGRLADDRPAADRLTAFYLWVAAGGVLGGLLNAVVAPLTFRTFTEYPLVLVLAVLAVRRPAFDRTAVLMWAPIVTGLVWVVTSRMPNPTAALAIFAASLALPALRRPALRAAAVAIVLVLVARLWGAERQQVAYVDRSFFGVLRVVENFRPGYRALVHGAALHGLQATSGEARRVPLTYYTREGPIGQTLAAATARLAGSAVGVVGLGAGELAAYAGPEQRWTFFEIDPLVERIARNSSRFTYLSEARAPVEVVIGDGRFSLSRPGETFAVLVIDAFSSDVVPTHLLTREALAVYLRRLRPDGVLAFHISNRFAELRPVVAGVTADAGLDALVQYDPGGDPAGNLPPRSPSTWVVSARAGQLPEALRQDPRWSPLSAGEGEPWTDERVNLVGVLRWNVRPGDILQ